MSPEPNEPNYDWADEAPAEETGVVIVGAPVPPTVDDDFESRLANAIKELDDPKVQERLRKAYG